MQQKRKSGTCDQRGDMRSGLEDENEAAGSKREGEKEEVRCEVLIRQKEPRLSEEVHEGWCEEVAEDRLGPFESVVKSSRGHRACRKAEVEEVHGSTGRQERRSRSRSLFSCR